MSSRFHARNFDWFSWLSPQLWDTFAGTAVASLQSPAPIFKLLYDTSSGRLFAGTLQGHLLMWQVRPPQGSTAAANDSTWLLPHAFQSVMIHQFDGPVLCLASWRNRLLVGAGGLLSILG